MNKKYIVTLTAEERAALQELIAVGKRAARTLAHARILRKADVRAEEPAWEDAAISQAVAVRAATVQRVRQRVVEEGLAVALRPRPQRQTRLPLVDGTAEAHLVTLACSTPPEGCGRWTLRLLAEQLVELAYVAHVSHETVRQVLTKNELQPWLKEEWCLPPQASGAFVCAMEDVREVYTLPDDPA
jgi:DDE superfamily endonuclease/Homeodomain-like domain